MTGERYITVNNGEFDYILDTKTSYYKPIEDLEEEKLKKAEKEIINFDKETYYDKIMEYAHDWYWDYVYNNHLELVEVCKRMNELEEENITFKEALKELKEIGDYQADRINELGERNNRQYQQLKKIYELIEKQDWVSLTKIIEELNEIEEQLQKEKKLYNEYD